MVFPYCHRFWRRNAGPQLLKPSANRSRPPRPNPEVVAKAQRRRFTTEYKQSILTEADAAIDPGAISALLRREGLYSSSLATWRQERKEGIRHALDQHKRGPRPTDSPLVPENQKLVRENLRLTGKRRTAEMIIDVPKKVAALLGRPMFSPELEANQ